MKIKNLTESEKLSIATLAYLDELVQAGLLKTNLEFSKQDRKLFKQLKRSGFAPDEKTLNNAIKLLMRNPDISVSAF